MNAVLGALLAVVALACSQPKPAESAPGVSEAAEEPAAPSTQDTAPPAPVAPEASHQAPAVQTLFVSEKRNDCQGETPKKCLQVRESPNDPWRNFFGRIEGFEYEEGKAYELRVEVTPVAAPAADASSLRYRLVEIVSQRKVDAEKH